MKLYRTVDGKLVRGYLVSSRKNINSDYSDEEYWYPETKSMYEVSFINPRKGLILKREYFDTLEEAEDRVSGLRRTATFTWGISEIEKEIQSSRNKRRFVKSSYWNDENFAKKVVADLNSYADENYNNDDAFVSKYGKLFEFKYRVEDDGTVVIYDKMGSLDMFDDDSGMTDYVKKVCEKMNGYAEAYDSSSSFTIGEDF